MTGRTELRWRKSSHSAEQAECVEVAPFVATWRKSSFSGGGSEDCVEVAPLPGAGDDVQRMIIVRDSKNPNGPRLHLTADHWASFTTKIKCSS